MTLPETDRACAPIATARTMPASCSIVCISLCATASVVLRASPATAVRPA